MVWGLALPHPKKILPSEIVSGVMKLQEHNILGAAADAPATPTPMALLAITN